jgi:hypothetical protein
MKSNHICTGISWGVLLMAACNPSIVEPIGLAPGSAGQSTELGSSGNAGQSTDSGGASGAAGSGGGLAAIAGQSGASDGPADCSESYATLRDEVRRAQPCTEDSECEIFLAPCVGGGGVTCSGFVAVSKARHQQRAQALDAYESCSGVECIGGGACLPPTTAWCQGGKCAPGSRPAQCETISDDVKARVANEETCSLVVRFNYDERGHALICGPRAVVLEADARASANAAAAVAGVPVGEGELLSDPATSDLWLFQQLTGDFGHASAVSAVNGKTLFWIGLEKTGDPSFPNVGGLFTGIPQAPVPWNTTNIASKCFNAPALLRKDLDVRTGQNDDPAVPTAEQVAEQVLTSALVNGMSAGGLALTNVATVRYGIGESVHMHFTDSVVIVNAARNE